MGSRGSRVAVMLGAEGLSHRSLAAECSTSCALPSEGTSVHCLCVREGIREQLCDWSVTREHRSANGGLAREKVYHSVAPICLKVCMCKNNSRHGHMEDRVRMALHVLPFFLTLKNFFQECRSREFRLFHLGDSSGNFSGVKK